MAMPRQMRVDNYSPGLALYDVTLRPDAAEVELKSGGSGADDRDCGRSFVALILNLFNPISDPLCHL